jgi:hypothetical protein
MPNAIHISPHIVSRKFITDEERRTSRGSLTIQQIKRHLQPNSSNWRTEFHFAPPSLSTSSSWMLTFDGLVQRAHKGQTSWRMNFKPALPFLIGNIANKMSDIMWHANRQEETVIQPNVRQTIVRCRICEFWNVAVDWRLCFIRSLALCCHENLQTQNERAGSKTRLSFLCTTSAQNISRSDNCVFIYIQDRSRSAHRSLYEATVKCIQLKKLRGLSPRANYTDQTKAAYRWL